MHTALLLQLIHTGGSRNDEVQSAIVLGLYQCFELSSELRHRCMTDGACNR